jgi:peptidoglycan/xylan/chitin deacetylase (PgdA/CDA1 family)
VTQLILEFLHRSGIPVLARLFPRRHLVVLNFHRVHDQASPFHDGMIEINSQQFREHLKWLARYVTFVSEREIEKLAPGGRTKMMLTFDDGYCDSHDVIAPILEELGIPATFFVAPGMLDRRVLGAWDRIAYLVKKVPGSTFRFRNREFSLLGGTRGAYLALGGMSQNSLPDQGDEFVVELATALGIAPPTPEEQSPELLTWNQVRDLQRRGFSIGCHSFSHRVLSSLSLEEQDDEIVLARSRLIAEGIEAKSFAYPFGTPDTYSWETREAALRAGYRLIFSFSGQAPQIGKIDPSRIDRVAFKSTIAKYDFLVSFPGAHNLAQRFRDQRHE